MFFAAALMLSAATAKRDISTALEAEEANMAPLFEHSHNDKKELISPERRFNLEAMIQASIEDDIKE